MSKSIGMVLAAMCALGMSASAHAADTVADNVVGYVQGNEANSDAGYVQSTTALGSLNGYTGGIPGIWGGGLTPFNSPFQPSDFVVVGGGGSLTLHLSNPVAANGRTLGVYGSFGLNDNSDDGSGLADPTASAYSHPSNAVVSVSQDGVTWTKLNGGAPINFAMPTNYYTDVPISWYYQPDGTQVAQQSKPFLGTTSDLAGKTYDQIKTAFNNSCGGNWLDLSGTGLPVVNYVRFDVAADSRMTVDAIGAMGVAAPVAPGGRIVSESVGAGAKTSHIVIDFGPQSYQFDVHYDGSLTGYQALQLIEANSGFAMSSEARGTYGQFVTSFDYGGFMQTGDGFGGTSYWAYYTGDGNIWHYSGKGASTRTLSDGAYDGWIWTDSPSVLPDFPNAPGTQCAALSGNWSAAGTWNAGGVPTAAGITDISNGGTIVMNQVGTCGTLTVGWSAGQSGAVQVQAGAALESNQAYIGYGGVGSVVQTGGGHRVDGDLHLGLLAGSRGSYQLSDGNLWVAGRVYVGSDGNGVFTQSGGRHTIGTSLVIAENSDADGLYALTGGQLIVPHISVGTGGTLELSGGALAGSIADGNLLTGIDSAGLVHITSGTYWLAFVDSPDSNTLMGTLEVDAGATLYVGEIRQANLIGGGTVILDVSMTALAAPSQSIGDLGTVPEPATLALLALGAAAVTRRRRATRKQ